MAQFIVPDWQRVVVPARQAEAIQAGGPVRQTYLGIDFIPQSGTMNLTTGRIFGKQLSLSLLSLQIKSIQSELFKPLAMCSPQKESDKSTIDYVAFVLIHFMGWHRFM